VGKGRTIHQSDTVPIPRQVIVQARGQQRAIYLRVRAIEQAACTRGLISKAQCTASDTLDEQWRRDQREIDAIMAQPDYEVDWQKLLKTLDQVGQILDKIPIP